MPGSFPPRGAWPPADKRFREASTVLMALGALSSQERLHEDFLIPKRTFRL